jgi:hypothetical protein
MTFWRSAVAGALTLCLTAPFAYSDPPANADGGQNTAVTGPALLRIRIAEGEGAVHTVGTRANQPILLFVSDETGRPVEHATVSIRLPEEGASGLFVNGLRTDVILSGADGRVVLRGIQWNQTPGPVQLRITASKGDARAGTVSTQYLTEPAALKTARSSEPVRGNPRVEGSRSKWVLVAALVGAAAAGGMVAAVRGGSGSPSPVAPPPAAITAPPIPQPVLSIGAPIVVIGRP